MALVLVAADEGIVEHDLSVADVARKANSSTLVVLSKWDVSEIDLQEAKAICTAACASVPGDRRLGEDRTWAGAPARPRGGALRQAPGRIQTAELNKALGELREARPGPAERGRRLRLLYGTQVSTRPPRFRIFVNDARLVTRDYAYWVENELRRRFGLDGVPVSIDFVKSGVSTLASREAAPREQAPESRRRRGGSWGRSSPRSSAIGHDVTLACRDP